jgi:hypothetical protein
MGGDVLAVYAVLGAACGKVGDLVECAGWDCGGGSCGDEEGGGEVLHLGEWMVVVWD